MKVLSHFSLSIQDIIYSVAGVLVTSFALKSFMVPNHFLDGGITGISLLVHEIYHVNIAVVLILANVPLLLLGAYQINWKFAFKSLGCIIGLAICLKFVPFPEITPANELLSSIFGGFFLGVGIGLAMRGGSAIDGIEVVALYTLKKSSFTMSEIILALNVAIFLIVAFHPTLGLEKALYATLTYYVATRTVDYVIEGLEEYTGVTIISGHSEVIKHKLVMELGRGITVYKGERGFMKDSFEKSEDCDIVFTVITRLEVRRLKNLVHTIDPKAFVFTNTIKETAGGVLKRHAGH